jgi:phage shock protein A
LDQIPKLYSVLCQDADYYQNKISELESEQLSMLKVAKERMTVVRSTVQAVNYTLVDIVANEMHLNENLREMQKQIYEHVEKTSQALSQTTLLIVTNQHMISIEHLIGQLKEGYDTLLFAITFAQK